MKQLPLLLIFLLSTKALCMNQCEKKDMTPSSPTQKSSKQGLAYFESNTINMFGAEGKVWLENLPKLVEKLAAQWKLSRLELLTDDLSYNFIMAGLRGTQPIILKIGLNVKEIEQEATALRALASSCTAQVLEQDTTCGALLLERATPGNTLNSYFPDKDTEALTIVCDLIQKLPKVIPNPSPFHSDADRFGLIDRDGWDIPSPILSKARHLKSQLLATAPEPILIHGDLHDGNIVQQGNHWIVIDPSGMQGEVAHEIAGFICNPYESVFTLPNAHEFIKNRILVSSQLLGIDPERIQRWCFLYVVWVWAWILQSGDDATAIAYDAQFLDPLTPHDLQTPSPLWNTDHFIDVKE